MKKNILITGGHVTPAIATIEYLLNNSDVNIFYVSRSQSDTYKSESIENRLIKNLNIPIIKIDPLKFNRHKPFQLFWDFKKFVLSLVQIYKSFNKIKPDVVLSFGGYVAVPVTLIAYLKRIPVVTHEQTLILGLANQLISFLANVTAISWPQMKFSKQKFVLTGNPVQQAFFKSISKPDWYPKTNKKIIYVTGGSQGSLTINSRIFKMLYFLLNNYVVIHQTGSARQKEDYKKAVDIKNKLPLNLKNNYLPKTNLSSSEVSYLLKNADLVISRSGANTVTELLLCATRSILIPLPNSGRCEQQLNAQLLEKIGLSTVLEQDLIHLLEDKIELWINKKIKVTDELDKLKKLHFSAAKTLGRLVLKCAA